MIAHFPGDDIASCLRCVFSRDAGAWNYLPGQWRGEPEREGGDMEDCAVVWKASPHMLVKGIYR